MIFRRESKLLWQKLIFRVLVITALLVSSASLCPSIRAQADAHQEQSKSEPDNSSSFASNSDSDLNSPSKPNSQWPRIFHRRWMAQPGDEAPIVLDNSLRRPFLFFRDAINQRWPLARLFFLCILAATLCKIFAPAMVAGAHERCRKKFLLCLASAFIYTTVLLSLSRLAFQTEALVPLALGCIALVQLSYIIGMGLGINIFANIISEQIKRRLTNLVNGTKSLVLGRWIALIATVSILTAISAIPELGRLPRLGNRLVVLVAIIGLGGLISDMRAKSRSRESL